MLLAIISDAEEVMEQNYHSNRTLPYFKSSSANYSMSLSLPITITQLSWLRHLPPFMEYDSSLLNSQQTTTDHYTKVA
jgi:hypothetical protein